MTDTTVIRAQLTGAAQHALDYQYRGWGFGEGPALLGVMAASDALGRPDLVDAVAEIVRPTLHRPPGPTDHLIPVEALVTLARRRPDLDVSPAVDRFATAVLNAERPVSGRLAVHRPDHPELGTTVWVDCLHTDGPGLALAGHPAAALALVEEISTSMQDRSGLYCHGYDIATGRTNGVHWARGQGWALHGLVGLCALEPEAAAPLLAPRLQALLAALEQHEVGGRWRTIVDDATSPIENSLSPLVAASVMAGIADGVVQSRWAPMAARALAATLAALDDSGALTVSAATPVGGPSIYRTRAQGVFPWGQGPVLLALSAAVTAGEPQRSNVPSTTGVLS